MGNYYSYKRISTDQERQNFNRQIKALEKYATDHHIEYLIEFTEEKSAKNFEDRKQFQKLDKLLQEGDTVVFKDLSRFTREAENGYRKYMEWLERGINIIFIDNPTISSDYIRQMMITAERQDIVTKTAMEGIIKLLLIVELDRAEQQRRYISKAITDGIAASNKKSGRKTGQLDKLTEELKQDIMLYIGDRNVKQIDLMKKYNISRNTLKKYVSVVKNKQSMADANLQMTAKQEQLLETKNTERDLSNEKTVNSDSEYNAQAKRNEIFAKYANTKNFENHEFSSALSNEQKAELYRQRAKETRKDMPVKWLEVLRMEQFKVLLQHIIINLLQIQELLLVISQVIKQKM